MDGLLVIDKPVGPTSHDVVARARRVLREKRIGHTGTLDPLASGVLPLVVGRATRLAQFLSGANKTYRASVQLGWATDSGDAHGREVGARHSGPIPPPATIEEALDQFRGTFQQQPPRFSAKKIGGVRSHELARRGVTDAPAPPVVDVTAHRLELIAVEDAVLTLEVECSAGFYVRSLAHELGARLGIGAHLSALRRISSGRIGIDQAIPLEAIEQENGLETALKAMKPLSAMLDDHPWVVLTEAGAERARHGRDLRDADIQDEATGPTFDRLVRLLTTHGELLGLADRGQPSGLLHPTVVLV